VRDEIIRRSKSLWRAEAPPDLQFSGEPMRLADLTRHHAVPGDTTADSDRERE
jgi:hypothetical protein